MTQHIALLQLLLLTLTAVAAQTVVTIGSVAELQAVGAKLAANTVYDWTRVQQLTINEQVVVEGQTGTVLRGAFSISSTGSLVLRNVKFELTSYPTLITVTGVATSLASQNPNTTLTLQNVHCAGASCTVSATVSLRNDVGSVIIQDSTLAALGTSGFSGSIRCSDCQFSSLLVQRCSLPAHYWSLDLSSLHSYSNIKLDNVTDINAGRIEGRFDAANITLALSDIKLKTDQLWANKLSAFSAQKIDISSPASLYVTMTTPDTQIEVSDLNLSGNMTDSNGRARSFIGFEGENVNVLMQNVNVQCTQALKNQVRFQAMTMAKTGSLQANNIVLNNCGRFLSGLNLNNVTFDDVQLFDSGLLLLGNQPSSRDPKVAQNVKLTNFKITGDLNANTVATVRNVGSLRIANWHAHDVNCTVRGCALVETKAFGMRGGNAPMLVDNVLIERCAGMVGFRDSFTGSTLPVPPATSLEMADVVVRDSRSAVGFVRLAFPRMTVRNVTFERCESTNSMLTSDKPTSVVLEDVTFSSCATEEDLIQFDGNATVNRVFVSDCTARRMLRLGNNFAVDEFAINVNTVRIVNTTTTYNDGALLINVNSNGTIDVNSVEVSDMRNLQGRGFVKAITVMAQREGGQVNVQNVIVKDIYSVGGLRVSSVNPVTLSNVRVESCAFNGVRLDVPSAAMRPRPAWLPALSLKLRNVTVRDTARVPGDSGLVGVEPLCGAGLRADGFEFVEATNVFVLDNGCASTTPIAQCDRPEMSTGGCYIRQTAAQQMKIIDSRFQGNHGACVGGLTLQAFNMSLHNVHVLDNVADAPALAKNPYSSSAAGGVFLSASYGVPGTAKAHLKSLLVQNNTAAMAGGLRTQALAVECVQSRIWDNTATQLSGNTDTQAAGGAGGWWHFSPREIPFVVRESVVRGNEGRAADGAQAAAAGGMAVQAGSVLIEDCDILDNVLLAGGVTAQSVGLALRGSGVQTLRRVSFGGNRAAGLEASSKNQTATLSLAQTLEAQLLDVCVCGNTLAYAAAPVAANEQPLADDQAIGLKCEPLVRRVANVSALVTDTAPLDCENTFGANAPGTFAPCSGDCPVRASGQIAPPQPIATKGGNGDGSLTTAFLTTKASLTTNEVTANGSTLSVFIGVVLIIVIAMII